ncbi:hypothetical protein [Spirochaeta africana]|uniref:Uncharacterized protein n=1 Tax=Spirochaeta africana (strain ATCC 700263 / DSM 8902 / Z-7692) TaxID=889378 RepID=H9UF86_SPIAZ|nr:hypothetical protein [Spirochaeta africana]AFG36179.1 hypothetical protein Spiaf_0070 [Spirochaeta africana DSM 8902]
MGKATIRVWRALGVGAVVAAAAAGCSLGVFSQREYSAMQVQFRVPTVVSVQPEADTNSRTTLDGSRSARYIIPQDGLQARVRVQGVGHTFLVEQILPLQLEGDEVTGLAAFAEVPANKPLRVSVTVYRDSDGIENLHYAQRDITIAPESQQTLQLFLRPHADVIYGTIDLDGQYDGSPPDTALLEPGGYAGFRMLAGMHTTYYLSVFQYQFGNEIVMLMQRANGELVTGQIDGDDMLTWELVGPGEYVVSFYHTGTGGDPIEINFENWDLEFPVAFIGGTLEIQANFAYPTAEVDVVYLFGDAGLTLFAGEGYADITVWSASIRAGSYTALYAVAMVYDPQLGSFMFRSPNLGGRTVVEGESQTQDLVLDDTWVEIEPWWEPDIGGSVQVVDMDPFPPDTSYWIGVYSVPGWYEQVAHGWGSGSSWEGYITMDENYLDSYIWFAALQEDEISVFTSGNLGELELSNPSVALDILIDGWNQEEFLESPKGSFAVQDGLPAEDWDAVVFYRDAALSDMIESGWVFSGSTVYEFEMLPIGYYPEVYIEAFHTDGTYTSGNLGPLQAYRPGLLDFPVVVDASWNFIGN